MSKVYIHIYIFSAHALTALAFFFFFCCVRGRGCVCENDILREKKKEEKWDFGFLHRVFSRGFWVGVHIDVLPCNQHASYRRFRHNIRRNQPTGPNAQERKKKIKKKNIITISSFAFFFFYKRVMWGGGWKEEKKRPYLQVPIHKPLYIETHFISVSILFSFFFNITTT